MAEGDTLGLDPTSTFGQTAKYEVTVRDPGSGNWTRRDLLLTSAPDARFLDKPTYDRTVQRAHTLWRATGSEDFNDRFLWDLAASGFDDQQAVEMALARKRLVQDTSILGRVRSIVGEPLDWMTNATEWVVHNTGDRITKALTHDDKATAAGIVYSFLAGTHDDYIEGRKAGKGMDQYLAEHAQSAGDQALFMIASVLTDPTVVIPAVGQLSKAGRLIRFTGALEGAEAAAAGALERSSRVGKIANVLGFRTPAHMVEKAVRLGPGEITLSPLEAWKSGRLGAYMKARIGRVPAERKTLERAVQVQSRGHLQGILPSQTPGVFVDYLWGKISNARARGIKDGLRGDALHSQVFDDVADAYAKWFDGRRFGEIQKEIGQLETATSMQSDLLKTLEAVTDPRRRESLRKFLAKQLGVNETAASYMKQSLERGHMQLSERLNALNREVGAFGTQQVLPRRRWQREMTDWVARQKMDVEFSEWSAPRKRLTQSILGGAEFTARQIEKFTAMTPHEALRVDDPGWVEQIRRLGQEYEFTLPGWTRTSSDEMVSRALEVRDNIDLQQFVLDRQKNAYRSLGVPDEDFERLGKAYMKAYGDRTFGVVNGKTTSRPLVSAHFFNQVPLMDPRLLRETARRMKLKGTVRGKVLERLDDADIDRIVESFNSAWKSLAAARPAYLFRVTMLSEVGRMMAAGGLNPVTSPLAWLNAAYPGAGGKLSRAWRKSFKAFGVDPPKQWDEFEQFLAGIGDDFDPVNHVLRTAKAPKNLGTINPNRVRALGVEGRMHGPGVTKYADLSSEGQRAYKKAWVKSLNEEWAPDPIVNLFLRDGRRTDEVMAWLDGPGRQYAVDAGLAPEKSGYRKRARAFLAEQRKHFEHLTRNNKDFARKVGSLTADDLDALPDVVPDLPIEMVQRFTGTGLANAVEFVDQSVLGKMWDAAGWFSYQVARKGPYKGAYATEVGRLFRLAKGQGADVDLLKILRQAAGDGQELNGAERAIHSAARNRAERFVKQTVYDLAESSRAADMARFIAPFGNAWQEELTRWFLLANSRPGTAATMWSTMRAGMDNPSFTWEDPSTGKKVFMLPFSDRIVEFATGKWNPFTKGEDGLRWPITIGWDNLFMLTGGGDFGPGFGPWMQIPAEVVQSMRPDWSEGIKMLFPYADGNALNTIVPTAFWRQYVDVTADEQDKHFAKIIRDVAGYHLYNETGASDATIKRQARALSALNFVTGLGLGGGMRAKLPPALGEMVDFYSQMRKEAPDVADRVILETHGDAMATWMESLTEAKAGTPPPTKEAFRMLMNDDMAALADEFGGVFWEVAKELLPGETFDPLVYEKQIASGQRTVQHLEDMTKAVAVGSGWAQYGLAQDAVDQYLDARGIVKGSKAAEPWEGLLERARENLFTTNPAWAESYNEFSSRQFEREQNILSLGQLTARPEMAETEAAVFFREYQNLRQAVRTVMVVKEYASLETEEALPLARSWRRGLGGLLAKYPRQRQLFERFLRYDPVTFDVAAA